MCVALVFFWSPDLRSLCIQFKYINTHTHIHTHHLAAQECMPAHLKVNVWRLARPPVLSSSPPPLLCSPSLRAAPLLELMGL